MPNEPRLVDVRVPAEPVAAVLVLHGGGSRQGGVMVSPTQLSVLRMIPIARRVARAGRGRLAVFRVLNANRGWDTTHTPVDDVDWALDQLRSRLGAVPVGLVGHSLGGRAALLAGDRAPVRSVVALAPWVYASEQVDLAGREVLIAHGSADRIARPARSAALARALGRTTDVGYVCVEGGSHAMLGRHGVFSRLAADFTRAALLGDRVGGTAGRVLAGEHWVDVERSPRRRDRRQADR